MDALHFLPPKEHRARQLAVAFLLLAPLAFGLLAIYLGQDGNWDLRNYHWYNAYAFLNGRYGFDMLPSQTPWFYNPSIDVPFYLIATHAPAMVAGFVLGTVQGINYVLIFMLAYAGLVIANPRHKVLVCAGLAALGMLGGGGIALIGTTFYDNITSLGLFASALLVIRAITRGDKPWVFVLCGIPAGLAMGFKLPCFTFCFGLCGAVFLSSGTRQRRLTTSFMFGIGILLGVAVSLGHWAWYLQSHFDSPLFPYFNSLFKSPLAPLSSARDMQYVPRSLHDFFLFPFIFTDSPYRTGEIPWRDWRIPILYVLLPIALIVRVVFGRSRDLHDSIAVTPVARYLLWATVLSYFAWLIMFGIYRYAVPIEMITPLLIVFAIGMLPIKPSARAMITGFVLVVIAFSVQGGNWGRRAGWSDRFIAADIPPLGNTSDTMLLMAGFEPYSHVLTEFPAEIPVVRIQSNFTSPDQDKAMNQLLHDRVNAFPGRFLLLIPNWQHKVADEALAYYNMVANWKACQTVTDRLYDGTIYDLCSVQRKFR